MLDWLKKILPIRTTPDMGVTTHPLEVNPTKSARQVRNEARMDRLRQAIAAGDSRTALRDELARREKEGR